MLRSDQRGGMVGKAATAKLASLEREYRDLAGQLAGLGFIASGSLAQRHARCGKPTCGCRADPPRLHGPYWHWTAKVDGRTVNKRLTEREARLYLEWIANDRKARTLLAQMRAVAAEAAAVIIAEGAEQPDGQADASSSQTDRGTKPVRRDRA
ncbi:MAG: DUF6788 family protein [Acidimicrobiales bacterium]